MPADPDRVAALWRERYGDVRPSRYVEGAQPAEIDPTERSSTRDHLPDPAGPGNLWLLERALAEHDADAVERRVRTRRDRDAADRARRTRRYLDGA